MMKCGYFAFQGGDWEAYQSIFKVEIRATEWAFERKREAFGKVAKDEAERLNMVQGIMSKSADFLRRVIHRASRRTRRCHDVVSGTKLQQFSPGGLGVVDFSSEEAPQLVVRSLWKNMIGERPTGYWWCKQVTVPVRQKCSKRTRCRKVCVKNQQKDGGSPIQSIVAKLLRKKQERHYGGPEKLY